MWGGRENNISCTKLKNLKQQYFISPRVLGYALDPSIDNPEVATKYIGSVEEAEKNQGK